MAFTSAEESSDLSLAFTPTRGHKSSPHQYPVVAGQGSHVVSTKCWTITVLAISGRPAGCGKQCSSEWELDGLCANRGVCAGYESARTCMDSIQTRNTSMNPSVRTFRRVRGLGALMCAAYLPQLSIDLAAERVRNRRSARAGYGSKCTASGQASTGAICQPQQRSR
jgi:hypothetical protein